LRAKDRPSESLVADQTVPAAPAPSRPDTRYPGTSGNDT
jgi:hypothetical protein